MDAEVTLKILIEDIGSIEDFMEEDVCLEDLVRDKIDENGLDYFLENIDNEYYIKEVHIIG